MQDWIVSLEGTQAEADAFIEQCARLVLNSTADQDNEELPWAVAVMEISKSTLDVVAMHALDIPFLTWRGTQVSKECNSLSVYRCLSLCKCQGFVFCSA